MPFDVPVYLCVCAADMLLQALSIQRSRQYDVVIFKKSARKNSLVNMGDKPKLACQIDREEDQGIRLLMEMGAVLLPPGYEIANAEDVLTGRPSKEAYVFREVGALYDQPGHVIRVWDST